MSTTVAFSCADIAASIRTHGLIDDHARGEHAPHRAFGFVAELSDGKMGWFPSARIYCVNEVRLDENGFAHLTSRTVGGMVNFGDQPPANVVSRYNELKILNTVIDHAAV